jgi:cytochrome c-type biogenesis protein CcmH/NrfG
MAAELGIVGLLSLLVFCGAILAAGLTRKRETLAAGDRMIRVAALGMFTAWLGATSVDWLYDIPGLAGMAILAAAMLVVPARSRERRAGGTGRSRGAQAALAVGLGILALIAAGIGRQYAAARYASSGDSEVVSSPARGIGTLETAESLDPYSLTTLYAIASAYARLDDYQAARDVLLRAERLEPDNYVPPALLGDLAFRRGDFGVALAAYEQAQRLDPREPALANSIVQTKAAL